MFTNCNHDAELLPVQNLASVTIVKVTKYLIKVTDVFVFQEQTETTKRNNSFRLKEPSWPVLTVPLNMA